MAKVKIDRLADEITRILQEYTTEVEQGLEKAKQKVAKDGAKKLRETSPKKTGRYAKGWTATKQGTSYVIHNKDRYQLAHLLEFGHAKVGGGRVSGKPHIKPVEEEVINQFEKAVEKVIKG